MQQIIFALWGKSNVGKSTTIKLAYQLLKSEADVRIEMEREIRNDFMAVALVSGKKVGFISEGDFGDWVNKFLSELKAEGCEIIICATRTRGGTVTAVDRMHPPYIVNWLEQKQLENSAQAQGNSNKIMAQHIVKKIRNAINA